jgi:hypothetical protein
MASRDSLLNEVYELALQNEMNYFGLCTEIHKLRYGRTYRLYDPEEVKAFHDIGGHSRTGCPQVCGIAARTAADIILRLLEPA